MPMLRDGKAPPAKKTRKAPPGGRMGRLPPGLRARAERIFDTLGGSMPSPRTELEFVNAYTLLVAVVLSAQATDKGVNRATKRLFEEVRTPQEMLALGEDGLKAHIRTIGLFNAKAANVMALSAALIERHEGEVPCDRASLEALPGVGRKTASVVLNEAFGEHTCAVDTHVFRVAHRLGLSRGSTPDAVEDDLLRLIPPRWGRPAHHLLILHGRYVCKARAPECWRCPLVADCAFPKKRLAPAGKLKQDAEEPAQPARVE